MHDGHHIDAQACRCRDADPEMRGMTPEQCFLHQRRNENRLCPQLGERLSEKMQVLVTCQNGEIDVAAELCGAVQNARLTAHEQRADAMLPQYRKDFDYRARDQANLPGPGMCSTIVGTAQNAAPASTTTIPASQDSRKVQMKTAVCS
jgi:hypothetical protein